MKKGVLLISLMLLLVLSPVQVFADTATNTEDIPNDVPNNDIPNPGTGYKEDAIAIGTVLVIGGLAVAIKLGKNKKKLAKI